MKLSTSTTSYLAVIVTIGAIVYFFCSSLGYFKSTEANQTQINQMVFGGWMLVLTFYYGSSKKHEADVTTPVSTNKMEVKADDVNVQENK